MTQVDLVGFWWFPDQPEAMYPGTLSITSQLGVRLELLGPSAALDGLETGITYPIVLGIVHNELVTVVGCTQVRSRISFPGLPTLTCKALYAVRGTHLENLAATQTDTISFELSHLGDWSGLTGVTVIVEQNPNQLPAAYTQRYQHPESVKIEAANMHFSVESRATTRNERWRYYSINESYRIKAEAPFAMSLEEWIESVVITWRDFLSLATREPNKLIELRAYYPDRIGQDKRGRRSFEVLIAGLDPDAIPEDRLIPDEMLFSLGEVESDLSQILQKLLTNDSWMPSFQELLKSVAVARTGATWDDQFFTLTRSLESFHREHRQDEDASFEIPGERREQILEGFHGSLSQEESESLAAWLGFPREPPLRKRLTALIREWNELMSLTLNNSRKRDSFVNQVVFTRNCWAHGSREACSNAVTGQKLRAFTGILYVLASAQTMNELGIDRSRVIDILRNKPWVQRAASDAAAELH